MKNTPCPDCGKGCCSLIAGRCAGNCLRAPATHKREVATSQRIFARYQKKRSVRTEALQNVKEERDECLSVACPQTIPTS